MYGQRKLQVVIVEVVEVIIHVGQGRRRLQLEWFPNICIMIRRTDSKKILVGSEVHLFFDNITSFKMVIFDSHLKLDSRWPVPHP